jgi:hypothetical protein
MNEPVGRAIKKLTKSRCLDLQVAQALSNRFPIHLFKSVTEKLGVGTFKKLARTDSF